MVQTSFRFSRVLPKIEFFLINLTLVCDTVSGLFAVTVAQRLSLFCVYSAGRYNFEYEAPVESIRYVSMRSSLLSNS